MKYLVFYAGLLYEECDEAGLRLIPVQGSMEIYNGAYFYSKPEKRWFRMDYTPLLDVDVPLNLKAMLLLIN